LLGRRGPRARESMDKEEERATLNCRSFNAACWEMCRSFNAACWEMTR
jgi:hypothetical protein